MTLNNNGQFCMPLAGTASLRLIQYDDSGNTDKQTQTTVEMNLPDSTVCAVSPTAIGGTSLAVSALPGSAFTSANTNLPIVGATAIVEWNGGPAGSVFLSARGFLHVNAP